MYYYHFTCQFKIHNNETKMYAVLYQSLITKDVGVQWQLGEVLEAPRGIAE